MKETILGEINKDTKDYPVEVELGNLQKEEGLIYGVTPLQMSEQYKKDMGKAPKYSELMKELQENE